MTRTTDFARLATARPVNRQAAAVTAHTPGNGQPWQGLALSLAEQHAVAAGEVARLRQQLADMGYETPLTTAAELEQRRQLALRLAHYERTARGLRHELRRAAPGHPTGRRT